MRKILTFLSCFLCYMGGLQAKIVNPVTSDGVKVIDLNGSRFSKQIDKSEKEMIKTLRFNGTNSFFEFNDKDRALVKTLPNLNTIEFSYTMKIPDLRPNISFRWFETLPNITKLVISEYSSNGDLCYPNIFQFIDRGYGKGLSERFKVAEFPNLKTVVYKIGIDKKASAFFPEECYALKLSPQYFDESEYAENSFDKTWGAHIYPLKGEVIFERGKIPNFDIEPTIIPANTKIRSDKYTITDNVKYVGRNAIDADLDIEKGNSWLILYDNKISNHEFNRPLIILGNFRIYDNTVTFKCPVSIQGDGKISKYDGLDIIFDDEVGTTFSALAKAKKIKFNKVPTFYDDSTIDWSKIIVEIPDGGNINEFIALGIPKTSISAISTEPISIYVPEPNKILSYLSPDKLKSVEDLKISGFLYDTDIKILSSCTNLKKLDLSNAIITESPQTQKERQENADFANAFFGLLKESANEQYNKGKIDDKTNFEANFFAGMAEADLKKVVQNNPSCIIPAKAFSDLKFLKTVILPQAAIEIGSKAFSNCPLLEDVKFPPFLKTIGMGAFYATGLRKVTLPETVESIGIYSGDYSTFGNCKNLKLLDFGNCSFKAKNGKVVVWDCPLKNNKMTLVLPKNIERIVRLTLTRGSVLYCPKTLKMFGIYENEINFTNITIYTQTEIPAQGNLRDCTIHVPSGALTAWYAKYHEWNNIVEGTSSRP